MTHITEPPPVSRLRLTLQFLAIPVVLGCLLFLPAGTWRWERGWWFLLICCAAFGIAALVIARVNPIIYRARSRFQPGTKRWDRVLVGILLTAMLAINPVAALDDGRFHWHPLPTSVVVVGYILLLAGIGIVTWAQAVNRFFEPGVRIQTERGHHVVDTGPYRFVRHPGYAAAGLMLLGMPLALGSLFALIPAAAAALVMVVRTVWEDAMLQAELPGYADYARRVRYRLVPGVW